MPTNDLLPTNPAGSAGSGASHAAPIATMPTDDDREWAWKWFELHVAHRTNVINFLLVAFGALAVAYAGLLSSQPYAAALVGLVAAVISLLFLRLDFVTMTKIDAAKRILSAGQSQSAKLFSTESPWFGDRSVTRLFELTLAVASLVGAWFAWHCSSSAAAVVCGTA